MTRDEIGQLNNSSGIVFGSILVHVNEPENGSAWSTFWKGKKGSDFKYKFLVSKENENIASRQIIVEPNEEKTFVAKLEAGNYKLFKMWVVYKSDYLYTSTDFRFTVTPEKATYIGKLNVYMPDRVKPFSHFTFKVEDNKDIAFAKVGKEYEIYEDIVIDKPMHMQD